MVSLMFVHCRSEIPLRKSLTFLFSGMGSPVLLGIGVLADEWTHKN